MTKAAWLAERNLKFAHLSTNEQSTIKVAVGLPYFPAKTEGFDDMAGCMVLSGFDEDEGREFEVFGVDPLQALCNGLTIIDFYLKAYSTQGTLAWGHGAPYDPRSDSLVPSDVVDVLKATVGSGPEEMKENIEKFKAIRSVKRD